MREMNDRIVDHEAWPARAALLAVLGLVLGLALDAVVRVGTDNLTEDPLRLALGSFIAIGGISFAFVLERVRWLWSAAFAASCGLVVALAFAWNGPPSGQSAGDEWRIFAALLAVAIAAPLFQSLRDRGRWDPQPAEIHAHAWTNIVLWFAAWAFVLISWLLAQLLAELFNLIGLDLLREALRKPWVNAGLIGAALGAATGLLRDSDKVLGLLQRVVTTVLSVLAPVLAVGLVVFVLALPIAGLKPLWENTTSTTPILLFAVAGAFFLANAVIGNSPEEEARGGILRLSAAALAAVMAPLAIVAAISTWLRIGQHGFTPERLWALVFVLLVLAVSLTYLFTVVRRRRDWAAGIRPANVRLAMLICGVALLLATPLLNFGAISTRDQVSRLRSGEVDAAQFDWAALRFDFGPEGREALEELRRGGVPAIRLRAARALAAKDRWRFMEETTVDRRASALRHSIRVLPRPAALPASLTEALAQGSVCASGDCTLFWQPGATEAVAIGFGCPQCLASVTQLQLDPKRKWQPLPIDTRPIPGAADGRFNEIAEAHRRALAAGRVEVREVRRRQVFIDGEPVAAPF